MRSSPSPVSVLLIEDEPLIALDLSETLEKNGYEVVGPATTLSEALSLLNVALPTLAIIDIKLRDGASTDLIRALRTRGVPFIIHSGFLKDGSERAEFQGAPWLTKPASPALVIDTLRRLSHSTERIRQGDNSEIGSSTQIDPLTS